VLTKIKISSVKCYPDLNSVIIKIEKVKGDYSFLFTIKISEATSLSHLVFDNKSGSKSFPFNILEIILHNSSCKMGKITLNGLTSESKASVEIITKDKPIYLCIGVVDGLSLSLRYGLEVFIEEDKIPTAGKTIGDILDKSYSSKDIKKEIDSLDINLF
jgi:hypothetical protein